MSLEKLHTRTVKLPDSVKSSIRKFVKNDCSKDFVYLFYLYFFAYLIDEHIDFPNFYPYFLGQNMLHKFACSWWVCMVQMSIFKEIFSWSQAKSNSKIGI